MGKEVLKNVRTVAEKICCDDILKLVENAENKINANTVPNVLIVLDSYGKKDLAKIFSNLFEVEIQPKIFSGGDAPIQIYFYRGNQITVENATFLVGTEPYCITKINYGLDIELLDKVTLTVCCGMQLDSIGSDILDDAEDVILMTNATMALPRTEKEWIKSQILHYYDCDRFAVVLYNKELLNTQKDYEEVCKNVVAITTKLNESIVFLYSVNDVCSRILAIPQNADILSEKRKNAICRNCVTMSLQNVSKQLEICSIDANKLKIGVEKVKAVHKTIEISGKIAVQNIVENLYNKLEYEIINAANEYNEGICENVYQQLMTTTEKNLPDLLKKVQEYINKSWQYFEIEADKRISNENTEISKKLAEQIEIDCGHLLQIEEIQELQGFIPDLQEVGIDLSALNNAKEQNKNNKKITKAALISGIGLTILGHPIIGIAAIVGSKAYQALKSFDKNTQADPTELNNSIRKDCEELCKKIVKQISITLGNAKVDAKENVAKVYTDAMDTLVAAIEQTAEKAEASAENVENLRKSVEILTEAKKVV